MPENELLISDIQVILVLKRKKRKIKALTHFLDFVEESDQPGNSSQPYQAEDPHKHQNSHHFVGLGGVVIVVVVQILEYKDEKNQTFFNEQQFHSNF